MRFLTRSSEGRTAHISAACARSEATDAVRFPARRRIGGRPEAVRHSRRAAFALPLPAARPDLLYLSPGTPGARERATSHAGHSPGVPFGRPEPWQRLTCPRSAPTGTRCCCSSCSGCCCCGWRSGCCCRCCSSYRRAEPDSSSDPSPLREPRLPQFCFVNPRAGRGIYPPAPPATGENGKRVKRQSVTTDSAPGAHQPEPEVAVPVARVGVVAVGAAVVVAAAAPTTAAQNPIAAA